MKFLKSLGTGILSLLLLVSLAVFGMAFVINSTLLNPNFVITQGDKLDLAAVARSFFDEQFSKDMPEDAEFIKDAALNVIADQEPWIRDQFRNAVHATYDFFLGKSDQFEIDIPLGTLKSDVNQSLWQTLQKFLAQKINLIPEDLLRPYIEEHYQELISVIPPQYLPSEMVGLSGNQLRIYLDQHWDEVIAVLQRAYLVPGVSTLILNQIQPYFNSYYDDITKDLPEAQVIDKDQIPSDVMEQLETARRSIGYFHIGFYALIALMVLLIGCIILINRNVRDSSLALGIVFLIYGIADFAGVLFARYFDFVKYIPDLPSSLDTWLPNMVKDALLPLQWFSLGILILGVALVVVSIVYKPNTAMD